MKITSYGNVSVRDSRVPPLPSPAISKVSKLALLPS